MIYLGIDDTDVVGRPGTNQFARRLARSLRGTYRCRLIVRHQLLRDPRVPMTSKNSAASLLLNPIGQPDLNDLAIDVHDFMSTHYVAGSDPGFCIAVDLPSPISAFGRRCQQELVTQHEARKLAAKHSLHLASCGGTGDGVIGALAAVGLASLGSDGRVVSIGDWGDDLAGVQPVSKLRQRSVVVQCEESKRPVLTGTIDIGKHLRPNRRGNRIVLFARQNHSRSATAEWEAVRLP